MEIIKQFIRKLFFLKQREDNSINHWKFALEILENVNSDIYSFIEYLMREICLGFKINRIAFFIKNETDNNYILKLKNGTNLPNVNSSYPLEEETSEDDILKNHILIGQTPNSTFNLFINIKEIMPQRREFDDKEKIIGIIALGDSNNERVFTREELATFSQLSIILSQMILKHNKKIELNYIDPLTRVFTREYFDEKAKEICSIRKSIAMVNIDNFQNMIHNYGTQFGDEILNFIGILLKHNLRQNDVIIKYEHEKFLIIFNIKKREAKIRLEHIHKKLNKHKFSENIIVSLSFGIADIDPNDNIEKLLENVQKV